MCFLFSRRNCTGNGIFHGSLSNLRFQFHIGDARLRGHSIGLLECRVHFRAATHRIGQNPTVGSKRIWFANGYVCSRLRKKDWAVSRAIDRVSLEKFPIDRRKKHSGRITLVRLVGWLLKTGDLFLASNDENLRIARLTYEFVALITVRLHRFSKRVQRSFLTSLRFHFVPPLLTGQLSNIRI